MTENLATQIADAIKKANGHLRSRKLFDASATLMESMINEAAPTTNEIRIYGGFVANSYKWKASTALIVATRNDAGEWTVTGRAVDAKRPYGSGAHVTVNGRAV